MKQIIEEIVKKDTFHSQETLDKGIIHNKMNYPFFKLSISIILTQTEYDLSL